MIAKKARSKKVSYTAEQYAALEAENLKLHKRILKLEAQNVSLKNGIIADADGKPPSELSAQQIRNLLQQSQQRLEALRGTPEDRCVLCSREPPGADPHAGWCGEGRLKAGPYPIRFR